MKSFKWEDVNNGCRDLTNEWSRVRKRLQDPPRMTVVPYTSRACTSFGSHEFFFFFFLIKWECEVWGVQCQHEWRWDENLESYVEGFGEYKDEREFLGGFGPLV